MSEISATCKEETEGTWIWGLPGLHGESVSKKKIFKLLAISIKMENPTPLCFPTECIRITCGLEGQWCQAREESDLKKDWVAVSSVFRCVLCHVLRGAGSWRSPWVWKKGAPKADLLVRGAGRGAPVGAGGFTCLFFCLFFLSKCKISNSGGNS